MTNVTYWKRVPESAQGAVADIDLALRLVRIGCRLDIQATIAELAAIPVGDAIKTGVTAYVRVS